VFIEETTSSVKKGVSVLPSQQACSQPVSLL